MNSFELTYTIERAVEVVWEKFFDEIHQWWSSDFYTNSKTKEFTIEMKLGGKMFEDFGDGEGLVWAEVIGIDKPTSLQVRGMLSGEFGGPAISYEKFSFTDLGGHTRLVYKAEFIGNVDEKTLESLKSGWKTIFNDYFIPFCKK